MVYKQELIGKIIKIKNKDEEIEIEIEDNPFFNKWIEMAENKLATPKIKTLQKQQNPEYKLPYSDIIKKYFTAEDILRNMKATYSVMEKHVRQRDGDIAVKLSDVRKMSLSLTNLDSYTQMEKDYINSRLLEYEKDYDIEKAADKFKAIRAIVCEMKILQFELLLANKPKGDIEIQRQIDTLDKQHAFHCDGLNVLKKQRDNAKAKPKDQLDLIGAISKLDKSNDELKLEVNKDREEEKIMINRLKSKKRSVS